MIFILKATLPLVCVRCLRKKMFSKSSSRSLGRPTFSRTLKTYSFTRLNTFSEIGNIGSWTSLYEQLHVNKWIEQQNLLKEKVCVQFGDKAPKETKNLYLIKA